MRKLLAYLRFLRNKIIRDKLSPNRVAAGWAIGMFCGCAIPFGVQLIVSIPLAILTKTSKVGATLATFITNPFTIFIIYPAQTWTVYRVLFGTAPKLPDEWTFAAVSGLGWKIVLSFFLGGFCLALLMTPLTYFTVRRTVIVARAAREKLHRYRENRKPRNAETEAEDDIP